MEYDELGQLTHEAYYDEDHQLLNQKEGYAEHWITYSESGQIQEEYFRNQDGAPAVIAEGYSCRILVSESPDGSYTMHVITETMTGVGECAVTLRTYDRYDRPIEDRYFDLYGTPAIGPESCSVVVRQYTSRGKISLIRYYNEAGVSTAVDGVYGIENTYNNYDNLETQTYLDADGQPTLNGSGYATIVYDYDLSQSDNVEKYFQYYQDAEGNPVEASNGAWGTSMLYYPVTRVRRVTYIGSTGEPVITTEGYAIME